MAEELTQEAFAPVLTVARYGDLDEGFALVNGSRYGLQAGIFTTRLDVAFRAHRELVVGGVLVTIAPLATGMAAFAHLGITPPIVISLAKREEEIYVPGRSDPIRLSRRSFALRLLQYVRDEAHRFAITGMRAKRAKVRVGGSQLEDIAGIGPKRRAKLMQRFGGIRGIAAASVEEIATVEGVSKELAETIYRALH